MRNGQAAITFLIVVFVVLILYFVVFKSPSSSNQLNFKNDALTVEDYFVTDVTPYATSSDKKGTTNIQFNLVNNGDEQIQYAEVDFFDLSAFGIESLNCGHGVKVDNKCVYKNFPSLDSSLIVLNLRTPSGITSPTTFTISYAIRYVYFGFRDANIPVVDGITVKQPTSPFREGSPSIGPVVADIQPSLDRNVIIEGNTVKQQWGISGSNAFPFTTKFTFRQIGSVNGKISNVNITEGNIKINAVGLDILQPCQFTPSSEPKYTINFPNRGDSYASSISQSSSQISTRPVNVPADTLICTFKPNLAQPEYTATVSVVFAYKYEYTKTQDFVVQPSLPGVTPTLGSTTGGPIPSPSSGPSPSTSSGPTPNYPSSGTLPYCSNYCSDRIKNIGYACSNGMGECKSDSECNPNVSRPDGTGKLICRTDVGTQVNVCCWNDWNSGQCQQAFQQFKQNTCP